ncbi:hypothetical protein DKX38_012173 [Salix brachista]|uniref:Uncharacterized protein n=1 Tax=Salix brachista TaxID=2182728 RepID=A0A5N5LPN1_9ROSI|nr:hypothetical protein DKX38_012173 [Salix brachista]
MQLQAIVENDMGSDISNGGDVYSNDIVLLAMSTRKISTDDVFRKGLDLHGSDRIALPERVACIADTILVTLLQEVVNMEKHRGQTVHEA